ncbi:hypothetical protein LC607_18065 [Nostoc sp. CHAB 5824]|nr:hypothetical protein [Nostoc sp. CHAB 5824]
MTQITGKFVDSGGVAFDGDLTITLDAPLVDVGTTPDLIYTLSPHTFTFSSGTLGGVNVVESATSNVTYHFVVNRYVTKTTYWLADGTQYDGPVVTNGGNYYTGTFYDAAISQQLGQVTSTEPSIAMDFHAIMPNVASVEFASLIPTRISTDSLPRTVRSLAELLTTDADFVEALRGGPRFKGAYSAATYYQRDDSVTYGGSSWVYINADPTAGQTPSVINTGYWQILAEKGDTGGTLGNDTTYDATGWNGATDAPSRNAVRDLVEGLLVKASALSAYAPLNNPIFVGTPTTPTPSASDRTTTIPNTAWVGGEFATINSPALSGTPTTPTPGTSSNSLVIANTAWVKSLAGIASGIASLDSSAKIPTAQLGFLQSLGASGYVRLPNNLLIQWAEYTVPSQSFTASTFYTFPISFPLAFSQVYQCVGCQAAGNSVSSVSLTFESLSTTQVVATIAYGTTIVTSPKFRVFAVGI